MERIWTSTPACPSGQLFNASTENSIDKSTSFFWDPTSGLLISRGFSLEDLSGAVNLSGNSEPEDHLGYLMRSWPSLRDLQGARILALTPKDSSLGRALSSRGNNLTELFASKGFLRQSRNLSFPYYVHRLMGEIERLNETFDCILVRHILEHLDDALKFLSSLRRVLKPNGFIFIEVPNVQPQIRNRDYTMLWDEHKYYFTEKNFRNLLTSAAWHVECFDDIHAGGEQVICVAARPDGFSQGSSKAEMDPAHLTECVAYFQDIELRRKSIRLQASNRRTLFLGANHSTATLLNMFGDVLQPICIIDESPNKVGHFLSSYRVEIRKPQNVTVEANDLVVSCINKTRSFELETRIKRNLSSNNSIVYGSNFG